MNRRFVRSVRRVTPVRPGAHRVNRSATDGCSTTSGTGSSPSPIARSASLPAAHSRFFARSRPSGLAPRAHHRARRTQPHHRRSRPPLEPLASRMYDHGGQPPEPEGRPPENVGEARLTCRQHPRKSPLSQVSPKREDLTPLKRRLGPLTCKNTWLARSLIPQRHAAVCDARLSSAALCAQYVPKSKIASVNGVHFQSRSNASLVRRLTSSSSPTTHVV